ncbi:MAG: galactose mutarotase [candidate division KSB1 bacterium]|nr:galactose mutarotase [candidate division KSB1 bacterium]
MPLQINEFGRVNGQSVQRFTLTNSKGTLVRIITYGGIITEVCLPDRRGVTANVCLGFDDLDGYLKGHPYFGCITGRFANRIANGRFVLDGIEYQLSLNHGRHHLHGGFEGFDKKLWQAVPFESEDSCGVRLRYFSPAGEEGYPGNLEVTVVYSLNEENELTINYKAETDAPTPVNLTNHAYWNLAGAGSGKIYDHILQLACSRYLKTDADLIPTGEICEVPAAMDFRTPKPVGRDIEQVGGYDHCFILDAPNETQPVLAARLIDPQSGRGFELLTTKPAVQLYTGNFLDCIIGSGGVFGRHDALCLETEYYPDAVNHPNFPSPILAPGDVYHHVTVHRFFIE